MATIPASSTSRADVVAAIASADYGDTVTVPSGSSTWDAQIDVSKYMTIQGNGIGNTNITAGSGFTNDSTAFFSYNADSVSRTANGLCRVTGFDFDGNGKKCRGVNMDNTQLPVMTQLRVDHNKFYDVSQGVYYNSFARGLIDNNTFEDCRVFYIRGEYWHSWENEVKDLGNEKQCYIEDNTITRPGLVSGGGSGGRYVFRYNTIDDPQVVYPMFDAHGNQQPVRQEWRGTGYGSRAMMIIEIYENTIINQSVNARFLDLRGGSAIVYNNSSVTVGRTISFQIREECSSDRWYFAPCMVSRGGTNYECILNHTSGDDDDEPGVGANWSTYWTTPPNNTNYVTAWATGQEYVNYPSYDMVEDTYFWNNVSGTGSEASYNVPGEGRYKDSDWYLQPDREFWKNGPPVLMARPVRDGGYFLARPSSGLSVGVGYWATDTNILYRATSTTTWETYYAPFTYPHPLQGGTPSARSIGINTMTGWGW